MSGRFCSPWEWLLWLPGTQTWKAGIGAIFETHFEALHPCMVPSVQPSAQSLQKGWWWGAWQVCWILTLQLQYCLAIWQSPQLQLRSILFIHFPLFAARRKTFGVWRVWPISICIPMQRQCLWILSRGWPPEVYGRSLNLVPLKYALSVHLGINIPI